MIETQQYVRKPLFVDAVRITTVNFEEIAAWCQGEILQDEVHADQRPKQYIKVRVHNPKNPRQTKAYVGDWILYTERGYKVYTSRAFHMAFDEVRQIENAEIQSTSLVTEDPDPTGSGVQPIQSVEEQDKAFDAVPEHHNPEIYGGLSTEQAHVSPEMEQAVRTIEAEGGEVIPATSQAIADVINEQQSVSYPEETTIGGTPKEEINLGLPVETPPTVPVDEGLAVSNSPTAPPVETDGKRVLSLQEQATMSQDEIRVLIQSGDAVLVQDIAA